jgi:hypothetical protein
MSKEWAKAGNGETPKRPAKIGEANTAESRLFLRETREIALIILPS